MDIMIKCRCIYQCNYNFMCNCSKMGGRVCFVHVPICKYIYNPHAIAKHVGGIFAYSNEEHMLQQVHPIQLHVHMQKHVHMHAQVHLFRSIYTCKYMNTIACRFSISGTHEVLNNHRSNIEHR